MPSIEPSIVFSRRACSVRQSSLRRRLSRTTPTMYIRLMWKTIATTVAVALSVLAAPAAQAPSSEAARRKIFDEILDTYVRDGFVYYRALSPNVRSSMATSRLSPPWRPTSCRGMSNSPSG